MHRARASAFFAPWKFHTKIVRILKMMSGKDESRRMHAIIPEWRVAAVRQRELRISYLNHWRTYVKDIVRVPLHAWSKYARTARRDNTVFYLLKEAYNRQRQRHVKSRIFKTLKKGVIHTLDSDGGICDTTSRMMVYKAYEEMKVVSR